jgi:hypothetical protein
MRERLKIPSAADRSINRNIRDFKRLWLGQPCCDAHIMVLKDVSRRGNAKKGAHAPTTMLVVMTPPTMMAAETLMVMA